MNNDYLIVINVIHRFYFTLDKFFITSQRPMNEGDFYRNINYFSDDVEYEEIFDDEGNLVYEGYAACGYPFGLGRLYFDNGNVYQEGIFDIKGLKMGKEYYYNGQLKFEGIWSLTNGYGPNAPKFGNVYDESGKPVFSGLFELKRGGVGYPMIKYPLGYRNIEKKRPDIKYIRGEVLWAIKEHEKWAKIEI